ncbi:MAG TPA: CPBP family intramembrane glutamate endopeptidase, partial [Glaciihabitans sp.]|nr:CPBP family intramembrane glutamate endopeptidase [Glaciihabitans sp.]
MSEHPTPAVTSTQSRVTRPAVGWKLLPAALLSLSAVLLFGADAAVPGYLTVAVSLALAALIDRPLLKDLALIAAGMVIISTVPL